MKDYAIEATGIGKCYRLYDRPRDRLRELLSPTRRVYHKKFWALRELDVKVERGECIGLVGVNGAGKSTALKILAGKLRPTTGSVHVRGRLSSILELGTGFHPHLTGRQNAFVNTLFMGLHPRETDRHVEKMLDFAELGAHAEQPLATYSSGMQARLAFASLVTVDPEILILDEALATGDARFAAKGQEHLRKLCKSGCTTIIASHDSFFLEQTCDRVLWVDHGRLQENGAPTTILTSYHRALQQQQPRGDRPKQVLLKFEAVDPDADPTFLVYGFQWLDSEDRLLNHFGLADERTWALLMELGPSLGFTTTAASTMGWGSVETVDGIAYRRCQPALCPKRAAFVPALFPQAPHALPTTFKMAVRGGPGLKVSLQTNGVWHELGVVGAGMSGVHVGGGFHVGELLGASP